MSGFVSPDTSLLSIDSINFDVLSSSSISKQSVLPIIAEDIYFPSTNTPIPYGVLDHRLGINKNNQKCKTCGLGLDDCAGHWGHIDLLFPVYHVGFFKYVIQILSCICKRCSHLLMSEELMKKFREQARVASGPLASRTVFKRLSEECKKVNKCPRCQYPQGALKKVIKPIPEQFLRIRHCIKHKQGGKMQVLEEDLDPLYVRNLFKSINPAHLQVLNIKKPESLLISSIPVPPNCIRPSVSMDGQGSTEDDLTCIFLNIVQTNNSMKTGYDVGVHIPRFLSEWQQMQMHCVRYINSENSALSQLLFATKRFKKVGRGVCQRLKGKDGRFRGNLSGKRVDFSARTVISPDPNVGIDQVVVPKYIAQRLTYPERVTKTNIKVLRKAVLRGANNWPGASYVNKVDGSKCNLRYANTKQVAERLVVGDIVERHVWDGDIVLFNRQPSLHRMSIMAHRAVVMDGSTFRFNECVCSPYNADFDGDEMNLHFPQTEEARAEAYHLMGVLFNLISPKNGDPLVSAVQDFLSASYLLTSKDYFIDRSKLFSLCCAFSDGVEHIEIPPPAIIYPVRLWTGKQVFSLLLSPTDKDRTFVNLEVKEREFTAQKTLQSDMMCPNDGYVLISNSELMCGAVGMKVMGAGKSGLMFHLLRSHGPKCAGKFLSRVSKLSCRWLSEHGFSIGLDDVTPSDQLLMHKREVLNTGFSRVKGGFFDSADSDESREMRIKSELDDLRNKAGKACYEHLPSQNKTLIMYNSGAKGSLINIAQMIACVGQQNVSGLRIQEGFLGRALPHFKMYDYGPESRGFVSSSFYSGLDPLEFFFHTMSGREGLIDTAVKTAETGYMQRKLMKALEDVSICYDYTVRNGDGQILQFLYGDDAMSPCSMGDLHFSNILESLQNKSDARSFVDYRGPIIPPSNYPQLNLDYLSNLELPRFLEERLRVLHHLKGDQFARKMIMRELTCYLIIHEMGSKANAPLFPFEINIWAEFISPLVTCYIPARLSQHLLSSEGGRENNLKDFETKLMGWIRAKSEEIARYRVLEGQEPGTLEFSEWPSRNVLEKRGVKKGNNKRVQYTMLVNKRFVITLKQLYNLFVMCWRDYKNSLVEPGDAVGALGAQSIGEPSTQMTLKTFHFAGVSSMNVTLGVPRIKEIISGAALIQTPIIEAPLEGTDYDCALASKYLIEKTTIGNICKNVQVVHSPLGSYAIICIDEGFCRRMNLPIDAYRVKRIIANQSSINKIKLNKSAIDVLDRNRVSIGLHSDSKMSMFRKEALLSGLMQLVVSGEDEVKRSIIKKDEDGYHLALEGYGLLGIMGSPGVIGTRAKSNHIIEVSKALGIEAARGLIISEICKCMDAYSIEIDYRHICLLGDVMTFRGEVLGINRFGIQRMRTSTLMLASFEETNERLFEAAVYGKKDPINGVSECIITGKPIKLGTGAFELLLNTPDRGDDDSK